MRFARPKTPGEKIKTVLGAAAVPLFLVFAVLQLIDMPGVIQGSRGIGRPGIFKAESEDCPKGECHWRGTFTGANGVVLREVSMHGGPKAIGSTHAAVRPDLPLLMSDEVYPAEGNWEWARALVYLAVFAGIGVGGLLAAYSWLQERRRQMRAATRV